MAYIVNTTETATAVATSYTVTLGKHQTGDLLLVFLTIDGGSQAIGFANSTATVSAANDTIGYTGSDVWTNGDQIVFTGTTAPNGLTFNTVYYVRDLDTAANTFKVAATAGGAAIDITSTGTTVTVTQVSAGANSSFNGWAILVQERAVTNVRHAVAYKIAASGAETNPTFVSASDDWLGSCVVVRDAHASPFGSLVDGTDYNSTAYSSATTYASGALTTAVDGCLLFYSWGTDGIGAAHHQSTLLSDSRCATKQTVNEICQTVSYRQQESAGAAPSVTMYRSNSTASTGIVLAVRNVANGALQPDVHPTYSVLRWYGNIGATHDATTTWQAPNAFATSIGTHLGNAINCSSTSPTTGTTSSGDDKANWGQGTSLASSQNASLAESASGAGIWVGGTHAIASTDMRGKFFGLQFQRNSNTTSDNVAGEQGIIVCFSDGTNWAAFQVQNKTNGWITFVPYAALIDLESATPFASSGTIDWSAVTRLGYFCHRDRSSTATFNIVVKNAVLFETAALTGGGANRPATFADLVRGLTSWGGWLWAELQGSAQVLGKFSVQIGNGGTNKTYFDAAASSIEYPPAYGTTLFDQMKWNSGAGSATINIKGGASDTINFAAGVAATETQQGLAIDAEHSTSANTSFAQSFVGFNPVTWLTGVNVSGATFSECGEIDAKGSDWTDCTIKKTTSTDAAIAFSEDGGSMTRCTINVTGTSAAYHLELGTAVTAITLADVTFTGTPGTDKVHVRKTTGTVTITTSGTTSLVAGDVTSEGATVVIDAPVLQVMIDANVSLAGAEVRIYDLDNSPAGSLGTELGGSESCPGSTFAQTLAYNNTVWIQIMKDGYEEFGQSYTMPATSSTFTAILRPDTSA